MSHGSAHLPCHKLATKLHQIVSFWNLALHWAEHGLTPGLSQKKLKHDANRMQEIEEAFAWEQDYDKVLALAHIASEKAKRLGLSEADISEPERIAVLVISFDAEIANGGFDQFFTNAIGDLWPEILHALMVIGATNTTQLMLKALAVFPNGMPSKNRSERLDEPTQRVQETTARLSGLSAEYYRQTESIFALATEYLRGHKAAFL
jgi:hypothetical protein